MSVGVFMLNDLVKAKDAIFDGFRNPKFLESTMALVPNKEEHERLLGSAKQAIARNPDLLKCDMASIYFAVAQCFEIKLSLSPQMGYAYLIPRKGRCGLELGYRGLLALARRSPFFVSLNADVVYEQDEFEYSNGTDPFLKHTRTFKTEAVKCVWVVATIARDGVRRTEIAIMSGAEVEKVRRNAGPVWAAYPSEMMRKSAVKRFLKLCPLAVDELDKALGIDDEAEITPSAVSETFANVTPPQTKLDLSHGETK